MAANTHGDVGGSGATSQPRKEDTRMVRAPHRAIHAMAMMRPGATPTHDVEPTALCHSTVVKGLEKYKKSHFTRYRVCHDKENKGDIAGPCLDATSAAKLGFTVSKVKAKIAAKCDLTALAANGYDTTDC